MKEKHSTIAVRAMPGNSDSVQFMLSTPIAVLIIRPMLACGGCTPRPRRLRRGLADHLRGHIQGSSGEDQATTLGAMWARTIRGVEAPMARAAST